MKRWIELEDRDIEEIKSYIPSNSRIVDKLEKESFPLELEFQDVDGNKWMIDFVYVAFPGLKNSGYRVEGYNGKEMRDFGTLIISNGELKIIQW